jgi:hypothetical protein
VFVSPPPVELPADEDASAAFRFPLVLLTAADEDALFGLGVRLRMGDESVVAAACREFAGVALADYPAEVFLQRTDILRVRLLV